MKEHKGLEFEVGGWTVTVDIISVEDDAVDFEVVSCIFDHDTIIYQWYDNPDEDDIKDEVYTYAIEEGLING